MNDDLFTRFESNPGFSGSHKELKALVASYDGVGAWKATDFAEMFIDKKRYRRLIWWPDTGETSVQHDFTSEKRRSIQREQSSSDEWRIIKNGRYAGNTFPQLFLKEPLEFMSNVLGGFPGPDWHVEQADIVNGRAQGIAIPRYRPQDYQVVHQFGPGSSYRGFVIRSRKVLPERWNGTELLDDDICLTLLHVRGLNREELKLGVNSLMREYDAQSPRRWDSEGCGNFFNEGGIFCTDSCGEN
jgi:hypothetical protein